MGTVGGLGLWVFDAWDWRWGSVRAKRWLGGCLDATTFLVRSRSCATHFHMQCLCTSEPLFKVCLTLPDLEVTL